MPLQFVDATVSFTALAGQNHLGLPLEIWLVDKEPSILYSAMNFDHVRLSATEIPEPAAWAGLLGGAAIQFPRLTERTKPTDSASNI